MRSECRSNFYFDHSGLLILVEGRIVEEMINPRDSFLPGDFLPSFNVRIYSTLGFEVEFFGSGIKCNVFGCCVSRTLWIASPPWKALIQRHKKRQ